MTIFLVGGSPAGRQPWGVRPGAADIVIAADRGAQHALAWGWSIQLLVGDLDSVAPEVAAMLIATGVPALTAPQAKDETDLELALAQALAYPAQPIVICAALGGRTDHLLANVLLLARPDLATRDIVFVDGPELLRLLWAAGGAGGVTRLALCGAPGDLLSLLPLGADAVGVTTHGLRYPLRDETLLLGRARGVSNVFASATASLTLRRGRLLIIHTRTPESPLEV